MILFELKAFDKIPEDYYLACEMKDVRSGSGRLLMGGIQIEGAQMRCEMDSGVESLMMFNEDARVEVSVYLWRDKKKLF